jgi:signal transduction histidine kinase
MPTSSKYPIVAGAKGLADWFIPASLLHQRSSRGLARVFVFTHVVSAFAALAVLIYLSSVKQTNDFGLYFIALMTVIFFALPFVLKRTGNMSLVALTSFQSLAITSFVGTFEYGGFASPFLPWVLVSLMTGLFYQSQRIGLVMALFLVDVVVFLGFLVWRVQPMLLLDTDLTLLSWVSIGAAMSYMAYMALYYARLIASRAELEMEAERYRAISVELEQARAAAFALNHTRSLFFSKMSHELRTPLNAVIGYSEILIEDFEDAPVENAQYVADLGRINSTGRHLLSLVADVLDVQTMENRESTLELSTVTLGQLCDDVVASAKPLIEEKGNRLVIDCIQRDDEVTTDSKKLRQMLINLLSNAAKFTQHGTITLELWIERNAPDDRLHAAVFDTGIGIAREALPKLFETYVQADKTIHGRFGGTGIGLALTRKFAGLLGGTVLAESQLGKGSSFTIDIPAIAKSSDSQPSASSSPDQAPAPIAALKLAEAGTR